MGLSNICLCGDTAIPFSLWDNTLTSNGGV